MLLSYFVASFSALNKMQWDSFREGGFIARVKTKTIKGYIMAKVNNTNGRTQSVGETNYQNKMFQGQQFETVEEAIETGAKTYAKLAWGEIANFCKELEEYAIPLPNQDMLAEMLINSKRKVIIASMQKRETMPKAFA